MPGEITVATLKAVLEVDQKDFQRDMRDLGKSLDETQKKFDRTGQFADKFHKGLKIVAALGLAKLGKDLFKLGVQAEAWGRRFEIVFQGVNEEMNVWVDNMNERFGVAEQRLKGVASGVGDLLVPMGFTRQAAGDMTKEIIELAAALDEWTGGNRGVEQTTQMIIRAMLGERDALVSLNKKVSQAQVNALLLEKGLGSLTGEARRQAEALATLELITGQSTDAIKAYEEGASEALIAQRNLEAAMEDLRITAAELVIELAPLVGLVGDLVGFAGSIVDIVVKIIPGEGAQDSLGILALILGIGTKTGRGILGGLALRGAIALGIPSAGVGAVVAGGAAAAAGGFVAGADFTRLIGGSSRIRRQREEREAAGPSMLARFLRSQARQFIDQQFREERFGFTEDISRTRGIERISAEVLAGFGRETQGLLAQQELVAQIKAIEIPETVEQKAIREAKELAERMAEAMSLSMAQAFGTEFAAQFEKHANIEDTIAHALEAALKAQQIFELAQELGAIIPPPLVEAIVSGLGSDPDVVIEALKELIDNPQALVEPLVAMGFSSINALISVFDGDVGLAVSAARWAGLAALAASAAWMATIRFDMPGGGSPLVIDPGIGPPPPGFGPPGIAHHGGIVPGRRGANVPIIAQAGEEIIPLGGRRGGITIHVAGSVITEQDLVEAVRQGLRTDTIRGGSMEF